MTLDRSEGGSRLQAMTSQKLYHLGEMSKLTQSIGREEAVPPPMYPDEPPDSVHSINSGQSDKRIALEGRIREQSQRNSRRFFGRNAHDPSRYAKHDGFSWFVVMWNHWQPSLKRMICHHSATSVSPSVMEQHLWNDGSDE